MVGDVNFIPVVKAGALEVFVGDVKAKGADEMQVRVGRSASAGNITSIEMDTGLKKYDVICHNSYHYSRFCRFFHLSQLAVWSMRGA